MRPLVGFAPTALGLLTSAAPSPACPSPAVTRSKNSGGAAIAAGGETSRHSASTRSAADGRLMHSLIPTASASRLHDAQAAIRNCLDNVQERLWPCQMTIVARSRARARLLACVPLGT